MPYFFEKVNNAYFINVLSGCVKYFTDFETKRNVEFVSTVNKGNNKITELRTILQRESQNS